MNEDVTTRQTTDRGTVEDADARQAQDIRQPQDARDQQLQRDDLGTRQTTDDQGFLEQDQLDTLRTRWSDVQTRFVDDPRGAVKEAHGLVAQLVDDLTKTFTRERDSLENQWNSGGQADTEQLRVTMQRYRSLFNRLLET